MAENARRATGYIHRFPELEPGLLDLPGLDPERAMRQMAKAARVTRHTEEV